MITSYEEYEFIIKVIKDYREWIERQQDQGGRLAHLFKEIVERLEKEVREYESERSD